MLWKDHREIITNSGTIAVGAYDASLDCKGVLLFTVSDCLSVQYEKLDFIILG